MMNHTERFTARCCGAYVEFYPGTPAESLRAAICPLCRTPLNITRTTQPEPDSPFGSMPPTITTQPEPDSPFGSMPPTITTQPEPPPEPAAP